MTDKDIISNLISNYDLLFSNYNTNKEQLRDGNTSRKKLLNTLVNLEDTIGLAVLEDGLKTNRPNSVAVDNSQYISTLEQLRDRI
jgi:hypothetical protein